MQYERPGFSGEPRASAQWRRVAALVFELARRLRLPLGTPGAAEAESLRRLAEAFVERIEGASPAPGWLEQIHDELNWLAQEGLYDRAAAAMLPALICIRLEDLLSTVHRLPVFPSVALQVLTLSPDDETSLEQVEALVSSDQVLAGKIIELANSSLLSPARPISTIPQALCYVGLERARRLVIAQVFRPVYGSPGLYKLWKHSIQSAIMAERLACTCRRASGPEAFLAGLMHDVGRLALHRLGGPEGQAYASLRDLGADAVFAELVLCGFDHGLAGSEILRGWSFPAQLVEAVRDHHSPLVAREPLAWILHVVECSLDTLADEDLPSEQGLRYALEQLGLEQEAVPAPASDELLASLLDAA